MDVILRHKSREWQDNLQKMLTKLEEIKRLPSEGKACLHLGCGPQILDGFANIDKYQEDSRIVKDDICRLKTVPDGEADVIYSSHALEHLPFRLAQLALHRWKRVLKPGGRLYLAIPDLEEILITMLNPAVDDYTKWNWYNYTLFGYQVDPDKYSKSKELDLPEDPGQFHKCGFTEDSIQLFLKLAGFTVDELFHYDGWSTPSLWVEATA